MEVQLDALRASADMSQAEAREESGHLRTKVTELEAQRDALARANTVMQQQAHMLLATRGSPAGSGSAPASDVLQTQVCQCGLWMGSSK